MRTGVKILLAVLGLGAVGGGVALAMSSGGDVKKFPGYEVDGCAVTITGETSAIIHARRKGRESQPFTIIGSDLAAQDQWGKDMLAALGLPNCDPSAVPKTSLPAYYKLIRAFLTGAAVNKRVDANMAALFLEALIGELVKLGVPAASLPSGLIPGDAKAPR